jgi:hypothetical protein
VEELLASEFDVDVGKHRVLALAGVQDWIVLNMHMNVWKVAVPRIATQAYTLATLNVLSRFDAHRATLQMGQEDKPIRRRPNNDVIASRVLNVLAAQRVVRQSVSNRDNFAIGWREDWLSP